MKDYQFVGVLLIMIGLAGLSYGIYGSIQHDKLLDRFEVRCEGRGGITLKAQKHGGGWIGCYTGLVELENEEK